MPKYRQLADKEIATLTVYGCSAENWKQVMVVDNFSPDFISNVHFSGNIFLGSYQKVFEKEGGLKKHSGIFNSVLHNCTIGNDVYIDRIKNYIANYDIADEVYIENVDLMVVDGLSSFGNGVKVATMIESGGREVTIFENLSSQFAYALIFSRHDSEFIQKSEKIISDFVLTKKSEKGKIGINTKIINCGSLKNISVGNFAQLEGVTLLENGTIVSTEESPTHIGFDVQCNDFIIQSGSSVTDGAMLTRCFVGQGVLIGKQFSAIDSLFFANCQGLHGEAVSVFAGPYTVTHHKSTLMLTALYAFMNAGSGTNFSNHMYKLGPVHQGITERGVKTSSGSYIMWPARIGAFSVVLGKHKGNPDLSDLPFSYLIENEGESTLLPGINLHSAGTIRDVQKWPKRDIRKGSKQLDLLIFDFLSPYTISKALKGIEVLTGLLKNMDETASFVWYQNCKIKRSSIKKGIELYEMAVSVFLGNQLIKIMSSGEINSIKTLFSNTSEAGKSEWMDLAGLFAPKSEVEKLIMKVKTEYNSIEEIEANFETIYTNYDEYSWNLAAEIMSRKTEKPLQSINKEDLISMIAAWEKAGLTFDDLILRDAKKEFNSISRIGFGLDGDEHICNSDFEATRGTFDEHSFVKDIQQGMKQKSALVNDLTNRLKSF